MIPKPLIAAINKSQQCVWGIGKTNQEALADANKQIKSKSPEIQKKGLGKISFAGLDKNAPLEYCGIALFKHCTAIEQQEADQADIFA